MRVHTHTHTHTHRHTHRARLCPRRAGAVTGPRVNSWSTQTTSTPFWFYWHPHTHTHTHTHTHRWRHMSTNADFSLKHTLSDRHWMMKWQKEKDNFFLFLSLTLDSPSTSLCIFSLLFVSFFLLLTPPFSLLQRPDRELKLILVHQCFHWRTERTKPIRPRWCLR